MWGTEDGLFRLHCPAVHQELGRAGLRFCHSCRHQNCHPHCKSESLYFAPLTSPQVGLHYDPNYFPNPERFDPDRFADKGSYDSITFQTFGTGPRWRREHFFNIFYFLIIVTQTMLGEKSLYCWEQSPPDTSSPGIQVVKQIRIWRIIIFKITSVWSQLHKHPENYSGTRRSSLEQRNMKSRLSREI